MLQLVANHTPLPTLETLEITPPYSLVDFFRRNGTAGPLWRLKTIGEMPTQSKYAQNNWPHLYSDDELTNQNKRCQKIKTVE